MVPRALPVGIHFWEAGSKGLVAYPNDGSEPPQPYDILVFDGGNDDGSVGHAALVTSVDTSLGTISFIQQNLRAKRWHVLTRYVWQDSLPLTHTPEGTWTVHQGPYHSPVAGWSRPTPPQEAP